MANTLKKRVDRLVHPSKRPLEWGNPLLSTTPTSLAIQELALRIEALERAVREIALEVQILRDEDPIDFISPRVEPSQFFPSGP
jgi:hypothetical protein